MIAAPGSDRSTSGKAAARPWSAGRPRPTLDPLGPPAGKGGHDPLGIARPALGAGDLQLLFRSPVDHFKLMSAIAALVFVNGHS